MHTYLKDCTTHINTYTCVHTYMCVHTTTHHTNVWCAVSCLLCGALAGVPHTYKLSKQLTHLVRVPFTQTDKSVVLQCFKGVLSRVKLSIILNIHAVVLMMHSAIHHVGLTKGHERDSILNSVVSHSIGVDIVAVVRGRDVLHDVPLSASLAYNTIMPLSWGFVPQQYRCVCCLHKGFTIAKVGNGIPFVSSVSRETRRLQGCIDRHAKAAQSHERVRHAQS